MYDANLARWMSPDPYGEFHSPYLAMGNNPVSTIDPDGGKTVADPTNIDYDNGRERRVDPFDMVGGSGIREDNIKVGNSLVSLNDDSPYSVEEQIRNLGYIIAGTGMTDSKDISHYTFNIYQNGSDGTLGSFNVSYDSEGNIVKSNNGGAINKARSGGGSCPNCLNPSTIGQQFGGVGGLTYPGGNNPKSYNGQYNYSYVPAYLSEYPAIGHDRRYDNLNISGPIGLLTDTRAIGADWIFVAEELNIAINPNLNPNDRATAGLLGIGLGLFALPKTLFQLSMPYGYMQTKMWYNISNHKVNNAPTNHKH
jgi:hypothetical protein